MAERPSTPPTAHSGSLPPNPLTPEQVRRTEEARLKAKAHRLQHDASRPTAHTTPSGFLTTTSQSAGQKRSHSLISGSKNIPDSVRNAAISPPKLSGPAADAPIRAAKKFEKNAYIEYDFSKMTDTKGGFLSSIDDPHNKTLHSGEKEDPLAGKPPNMTLKEWERTQLLKKLRAARAGPFEPGLSVLAEKRKDRSCRDCGSLEIDFSWVDIFSCPVCNLCKEKYPEKYSLLTKTEAREDYLLTNPELEDKDLLPRLEKPNPHKSTWNNMQLYLRYQVEEYAFSDKKWGSTEALDTEFERREGVRKTRKEQKFKSKLQELKKKTRVEAYRRSRTAGGGEAKFGDRVIGRNERHIHEWGRPVENPETGLSTKRCVECGMECEELEL